MIITISGKHGSGKSMVAKAIAKEFRLKHYSMGDLQRQIAREKGITFEELGKLEEKDDKIDNEIDNKQASLGKNEDNFVIDSVLGFYFIPNSIKIFLDVSEDESAKRIFNEKRDVENFKDIEETKKALKRRVLSEEIRFSKHYKADKPKYDFYLDTTKISKEEVVKRVIDYLLTKAKIMKNP